MLMKKNAAAAASLFLCLSPLIPPAFADQAYARVNPTKEGSDLSGDFVFQETEQGLRLSGTVSGLTPGKHGFHVHEFGSCGDAGKEAGSHFNPHEAKHGYLPEDKLHAAHAGDFGNLEADSTGKASVDITLPGLKVSGNPFAVAGRALIIHEKEDDFSQPLGNAGSRVGCGLIVISKSTAS